MTRLFVDTGAWLAYTNHADPDHRRVAGVLETFRGRLVTSNFIFDETVTLVLYRLGHPSAVKVGSTLLDSSVVDVVRVTTADEQSAWKLFTERADKTYSYTDCTSFVLMRRLKIGAAAALDEDFEREGFSVAPGR